MTDSELIQLVAGYKPRPEVLKAMADIKILATVGPSASGKTTLMKALVAKSPKVKFILDETSRVPRPNEVNGKDFLFRTKGEILEDLKKGELVQLAIGPNGELYSTRLSSYPKDRVGIIALIPSAVKNFRQLPIKFFQAAFIIPYSFEVWQKWLAKQSKAGDWSREKLQSRLAEAKQSYEFALADKDIHFVLNDDIDRASARLQQILEGKSSSDEDLARITAEENYQQLLKLLNPRTKL